MRPTTAFLVFALTVVSLSARADNSAPVARRRALIIGIDHYRASPRWRDLDGAVNDAKEMAALLQARFGYRPEDVKVLIDGDATRDAILSAFKSVLVEAAHDGDIGVFYYAGHGSVVKNLKSPKPGQLDETIVPADGQDIRDVELGRLAEAAADRGLRLTMILDSCHSGSATRGLELTGKVRLGAPDLDNRISDDSPRPAPDKKGVLTLSAARAEQLAGEAYHNHKPHGAFTAALLDTLASSAVDASAETIFIRTHALVKAIRAGQDPSREGPSERPLFTPASRTSTGKSVIAVAAVKDGEVELLGGGAILLAQGATLIRHGVSGPRTRLTVKRVLGAGRSVASIADATKDGDPATVRVGDLFEIDRYALTSPEPLRIEIGETVPLARLLEMARRLAPLRRSGVIRLVDDPTAIDPTHVLSWRSGAWILRGPEGDTATYKEELDAARLEKVLAGKGVKGEKAPCDHQACLFVKLPLPAELTREMKPRWEPTAMAPVVVGDSRTADYSLIGRLGEAGPEFALLLVKGGVRGGAGTCSPDSQLPVRSDWIPMAVPTATTQAASKLDDLALRLGRVAAWLTFRGPQDDPDFPWRLELSSGGRPLAGSNVAPGARIDLELVRTGPGAQQRFPYVFAIDCKGAIDAAYPEPGREPDLLPGRAAEEAKRIRLGTVALDETRGRYSFLLIVTDEQLPSVEAVVQPGVRRGGPPDGTPLGEALFGLGRTRGITRLPKRWTVERVGFLAEP